MNIVWSVAPTPFVPKPFIKHVVGSQFGSLPFVAKMKPPSLHSIPTSLLHCHILLHSWNNPFCSIVLHSWKSAYVLSIHRKQLTPTMHCVVTKRDILLCQLLIEYVFTKSITGSWQLLLKVSKPFNIFHIRSKKFFLNPVHCLQEKMYKDLLRPHKTLRQIGRTMWIQCGWSLCTKA